MKAIMEPKEESGSAPAQTNVPVNGRTAEPGRAACPPATAETATARESGVASQPGGAARPPAATEPATAPKSRAVSRLVWGIGKLLTRLLYRLKVSGRENLPQTSGALLIANHPSLIDAFFIGAACDRPVRFLMNEHHYRNPVFGWFASLAGAIPICSDQRPRDLVRSLRTASNAVKSGELVCIFAEGQVTRTGQMLPFRRGFERIMDGLDAPVIPVCLEGVWGSIFSFAGKRFLWKWPRNLSCPVSVSFGKPMTSRATPAQVRQAIQELATEACQHRKGWMHPIHRGFVRAARKFPFRFAMADQRCPKLSFISAVARTIYLARRLRPHWSGQEKVGILLPPSIAGALVNFAALLMGKVPVNLNYTASGEVIAASVRQCGITTILSSEAFMEKVKLELPLEPLLLERVAAAPRLAERLASLAMAGLFPVRMLERSLGCSRRMDMDDLATIIFSSGSTGDPKGVLLSHFNVVSNVAQLAQVFHLDKRDRMLGVLPFFHSFGFTGTLALTGTLGVGVAYYPTPLDAEAVGRLVRRYSLTFLLTTPTFLQLYLRGCPPEDFGSLRVVMAGAEKLPERLAAAFEERFGITPLEGYGCTECAPAVAVNAPGFRSAGFCQLPFRRGRIGHALPGVCVRIVDPLTDKPMSPNEPGLMLVRGPNVMQGYLDRPEKTAEVLHDGWYVTGDIASMDEDGFIQITDRRSRFSKIGGEMVPHIKVEEKLQELTGSLERCVVVTGVADEKKGERLVVLHCLEQPVLEQVIARLPQVDLPKLWVPKANQFFRLEIMPVLGSGKLDLRKVRELATERAG